MAKYRVNPVGSERLDRLNHFIDILRQVESEGRPFDMSKWIDWDSLIKNHNRTWSESPQYRKPPTLDVPAQECGTASCALGWAARDPYFKKLGLKWSERGGNPTIKKMDDLLPIDAGAMFFGITENESDSLFSPCEYKNRESAEIKPRHVITKIRRLIKKYTKHFDKHNEYLDEQFVLRNIDGYNLTAWTVKEKERIE